MPKSAANPPQIHFPIDIRGWAVMTARCPTCPFRPEGGVELANRIRTGMFKGSQLCHHPRLHHRTETQLCRGARDEQLTLLYRLGLLDAPTDACFAEASAAAAGAGPEGSRT